MPEASHLPERLELAASLRALREGTGQSGTRFAQGLGWQQSRVSRLETGKIFSTEDDIRAWGPRPVPRPMSSGICSPCSNAPGWNTRRGPSTTSKRRRGRSRRAAGQAISMARANASTFTLRPCRSAYRSSAPTNEIPVGTVKESRWLVIGLIGGKHWSAWLPTGSKGSRLSPSIAPGTRRWRSMKAEEVDQRFDQGDDVTPADLARRPGYEQRRVDVDFPYG